MPLTVTELGLVLAKMAIRARDRADNLGNTDPAGVARTLQFVLQAGAEACAEIRDSRS